MDEQTIKVLARFTEVGQWWPVGAWIYSERFAKANKQWWKIEDSQYEKQRIRLSHEICEAEMNQKGVFRESGK